MPLNAVLAPPWLRHAIWLRSPKLVSVKTPSVLQVPEPRLAWYDWVALGVNAYHQLLLGGDGAHVGFGSAGSFVAAAALWVSLNGTLAIAIAPAKSSFDGAGTSVALRRTEPP